MSVWIIWSDGRIGNHRKTALWSAPQGGLFTQLVCYIGQQGNHACALDRDGELTLMSSAGAGSTAGQDLAALGSIAAELGGILEINARNLIDAEVTYLLALARTSLLVHSHE